MTSRRVLLVAVVAVVAATGAVYAPHLGHPFLHDDVLELVANPELSDPAAYFAAFARPGYHEETTRLVPNLTLALDHAIHGWSPFGFHLTQLLWHLANVVLVALLGDVLLRRVGVRDAHAPVFAAAIFGLHPLVSEAVLYDQARSNVVATTFYVLALLAWVRLEEVERPAGKPWLAVFAFALVLALLSKELAVTVVVMAPLAGAWLHPPGETAATSPRGRVLAASAVGAGLVATLATGGARGLSLALSERGWGGFGTTLLEQAAVLLRYLGLALVPWPGFLDVDHSGLGRLERRLSEGPSWDVLALPVASLLVVVALLAACVAWRRRAPVTTFLVLWWFVTHAPTSLLPRDEVMVEYRTYLPMVGLSLLFGWALDRALARLAVDARTRAGAAIVAAVVLGAMLAAATTARAGVWASAERLWRDAAAKDPRNPRALTNLGLALEDRGATDDAADAYRRAMELDPDYTRAHNNLGNLLLQLGKVEEAVETFRLGLARTPDFAVLHSNLGRALVRHGMLGEAVGHHERAREIAPDAPAVLVNLAAALSAAGRPHAAIEHLEHALALEPDAVVVHIDLAHALASVGRTIEAVDHYRRALALAPDHPGIHTSLGALLAEQGEPERAIEHLERAVALDPESADAHSNLAALLARQAHYPEAIRSYERALELQPDHATARAGLAAAHERAASGGTAP